MNKNNDRVPCTGASAMGEKFVGATSAAAGGGRRRDLQMAPSVSVSGIMGEVVQLNRVQGHLKSVLTAAEGKEMQNAQLVRYLREARHEASQTEDLLSELEYYHYHHIQEELEPEGYRIDGFPGQRHSLGDLEPQVHLYEEDGNSEIGVVDMEKVAYDTAESSRFIREHSSSAVLQIMPYVCNTIISPSNSGREFYLGLSREIYEHIEACSSMTRNLCEALELENLDDRIIIMQQYKSTTTDPRETSACPTKPKVYGRDQERNLIISKLVGEESGRQNLSVLAIIGDGGVGKTTLANVVFNDSAVSNHFNILLWVYVSVYFDQAKIIHKLLESLTGNDHEHIKGLKELQSILGSAVKSKRFLLVLDDMWEDSQKEKWDEHIDAIWST